MREFDSLTELQRVREGLLRGLGADDAKIAEIVEAEKARAEASNTPLEEPVEAPTVPTAAGAFLGNLLMGTAKGLLFPVSSFAEGLYERMDPIIEQNRRTMRGLLKRPEYQDAFRAAGLDTGQRQAFEDIAVATPDTVGNLGGQVVGFGKLYSGTRAILKAAGIAQRGATTLTAVAKTNDLLLEASTNLIAATAFSAGAKLEDGQSRISRIAVDFGLGTVLGSAQMWMVKRGLKEELDPGALITLSKSMPEESVAKVRAGVGTPEEAQAVVTAAKLNPAVGTDAVGLPTPLVAQAHKTLDAVEDMFPRSGFTVDPALKAAGRPGVYVKMTVNDVPVDLNLQPLQGTQYVHVATGSSPAQQETFVSQARSLRAAAIHAQRNGVPLQIDEVRVGDEASMTHFWKIVTGQYKQKLDRRLPIPGTALKTTAAVQGDKSIVIGSRYRVIMPNGQTVFGTAVDVSDSGRASIQGHLPGFRPVNAADDIVQAEMATFAKNPGQPSLFDDVVETADDYTPPPSTLTQKREFGRGTAPLPKSDERTYKAFIAKLRERGLNDGEIAEKVQEVKLRKEYFSASQPRKGEISKILAAKAEPARRESLKRLSAAKPNRQYVFQTEHGTVTASAAQVVVRKPGDAPFRPSAKPDGSPARILVDPDQGIVHWEGLDAGRDADNAFGTDWFTSLDPDSDYHLPRVWALGDDAVDTAKPSLVLDIPAAETKYVNTQTGVSNPAGSHTADDLFTTAYDRSDPRPDFYTKGVPTPVQKAEAIRGRATDDRFPLQGDERFAKKSAGFEPMIPRDKMGRQKPVEALKRKQLRDVGESSFVDDLDELDEVTAEGVDLTPTGEGVETAATRTLGRGNLAAGEGTIASSPLPGMTGVAENRIFPSSYHLRKGELNHPEFVTAQKTAKTLIKDGVDPSTKVSVRIARDGYAPTTGGDSWTLQELADAPHGLPSWEQLAYEADIRGMELTPRGAGAVVGTGGIRYTYATQLEALEMIQKVRRPSELTAPKIEDSLEAMMNMGRGRRVDPDIDITHFNPEQFQERAVQELLEGRRPLVTVRSSDEHALRQTLGNHQQRFGVLRIYPDSRNSGGVFALYDPMLVKQQVAKLNDAVGRDFAGVNAQMGADEIVSKLARNPQLHSLDVLYGRDPVSAAYYSELRRRGSREIWKRGVVQRDALGPFRSFSPDDVAKFTWTSATPGHPAGDELYQYVGGVIPKSMGDGAMPTKPPIVDSPGGDAALDDQFWLAKELDHVLGNRQASTAVDSSGNSIWNRYFGIPDFFWQDRQTATNVPYASWHGRLETARTNVEIAQNQVFHDTARFALNTTKEQRYRAQMLFEARVQKTGLVDDILKNADAGTKELADTIEASYRKFFTGPKMGWTNDELDNWFEHAMPSLRRNDSKYVANLRPVGALGKASTFADKAFADGPLAMGPREWDPAAIMRRITRAAANEKYMEVPYQHVKAEMTAYVKAGKVMQDDMWQFAHYMNEIMHVSDAAHISQARMMQKAVEKFGKVVSRFSQEKGEKIVQLSREESFDIANLMMGTNVIANMGWHPGVLSRNFIGGMQQTFTYVRSKYVVDAMKWLAKGRREPGHGEAVWGWLEKHGVVARDAAAESIRDIAELTGVQSKGLVTSAASNAILKSTKWYKNIDDVTRAIAYKGRYEEALDYGRQYAAKKIDLNTFLTETRARFLGPIRTAEITEMVQRGDIDAAAHHAARYLVRSTQFVYTRGNVPYAMQSTWGRLFGQYGTWPAWYADTMKRIIPVEGFGYASKQEKLRIIGRWTATQGAVYGAMSEVFGIDYGRWAFFSPLGYSGGPAAQMAGGLSAVAQDKLGGGNDIVTQIQSNRAQRDIWRQLIPVPTNAAKLWWDGTSKVLDGDLPEGLRLLAGYRNPK